MNYVKTTETFRSADLTHDLRYYIYRPAVGEVRAILQISHGMCEYMGRYEEFADYLCGHGILVCGHEHLGHGPAAQEDGSLGFFAKKDGWKLLPADTHKLTSILQTRYPGIPCFLLGHSMGSFIARIYLALYGEQLNGAILMGTSGRNPLCGIGVRIADRVARKKGERFCSNTLRIMSMGSYNKKFKEEQSPSSWLTKVTEIRERYEADPLCNFSFTASGYRDLFTLLQQASSQETFDRTPKTLPVLLVSGMDDPVGSYGKGVTEVYERMRKAGMKDVTQKLYPNDRHEILNETDRENVYADLLAFLEEKLPKTE